jgi:hypothetical protein
MVSLLATHHSHDISENTRNGYAFLYDTEKVYMDIGGASGLFATSLHLKFDPLQDRKWFVKTGAGYSCQQFPTAKLTALYGSLATGYMVQNDLYVEAGGAVTKHNDSSDMTDETIKNIRGHATKRWESPIGTVDTAVAVDRIFQTVSDKNYYTGVANYYPADHARLGFGYSYSDQSISNNFIVEYGYLRSSYTHNLTYDIQSLSVGVQFAFSDLMHFSSYRMPTNIKRHISE